MPNPTLEDTIARIGELHGNMAVLAKLDAILRDERSSLADAGALIQTDGALAAAILRISNSAHFGNTQKCEDLATALHKVGYREVVKLVSLALSKQVFMNDLDAYGITADDYWNYSYFSALFMERQAVRSGLNSEVAYLIGLLHSIGRVIINELLRADQVEVYWDHLLPPSQWEIAMVGFSSEAGGAQLLRSWQFPAAVYQRVAAQNNEQSAEADPMLALLRFTRHLAIHKGDLSKLAKLRISPQRRFGAWTLPNSATLQADALHSQEQAAATRAKLQG